MTLPPPAPLALRLDSGALRHNWQWLADQSHGAACGAAVKAVGYGLGAVEVAHHLKAAGCRDFFVATWSEAVALRPHLGDAGLSVLHGIRPEDMTLAMSLGARPVLNTPAQVARWREARGGPCDVMIDTGMNRLGLDPSAISAGLLDGLQIDIVMSHLACADEEHPLNERQRVIFAELIGQVNARRSSLANSAGILLGRDYAFDLTRPGLALYGGVPRAEAQGHIRQVVHPRAQILQRRTIVKGASVGYGATYIADREREVAILNVGYADGYFRGFSDKGHALSDDGAVLPVRGRVSMDLIAIDVSDRPKLSEGDWLEIAFDLPTAAVQSGMSQYELLTSLGKRFDRSWT
jgi:alanine racemase